MICSDISKRLNRTSVVVTFFFIFLALSAIKTLFFSFDSIVYCFGAVAKIRTPLSLCLKANIG